MTTIITTPVCAASPASAMRCQRVRALPRGTAPSRGLRRAPPAAGAGVVREGCCGARHPCKHRAALPSSS
jgi:hypothetical protein